MDLVWVKKMLDSGSKNSLYSGLKKFLDSDLGSKNFGIRIQIRYSIFFFGFDPGSGSNIFLYSNLDLIFDFFLSVEIRV